MFISYVIVPAIILLVISGLFSFVYYRISHDSVLAFENSIAENVDAELKNTMDNLIKSSAQYAMTPWVMRLKYMQKTPELMEKNVKASDISDYVGMISLAEINDNMIESIYIYYSLGEFGISSYGKSGWKKYVDINQIACQEETFMSGDVLGMNNQKRIFHDVSLVKNGRRISGFFLVQTIPLGNIYSGEVNILFFVPYHKIYTPGKWKKQGWQQRPVQKNAHSAKQLKRQNLCVSKSPICRQGLKRRRHNFAKRTTKAKKRHMQPKLNASKKPSARKSPPYRLRKGGWHVSSPALLIPATVPVRP